MVSLEPVLVIANRSYATNIGRIGRLGKLKLGRDYEKNVKTYSKFSES